MPIIQITDKNGKILHTGSFVDGQSGAQIFSYNADFLTVQYMAGTSYGSAPPSTVLIPQLDILNTTMTKLLETMEEEVRYWRIRSQEMEARIAEITSGSPDNSA